jgi:signal transduction histidine kinase
MIKRLFISFLVAVAGLFYCYGDESQQALLTQLNSTHGAKRLALVRRLADSYWNNPKQEQFLNQLYDESLSCDSLERAGYALAGLAKYYHNNDKDKKLQLCNSRIDILARQQGHYSDYYFRVKSFMAQRLLWQERHSEAVDYTQNLYKLALKYNNLEGRVCCQELFALIYQSMGNNNDALKHIRIALNLINGQNYPDFRHHAQLLILAIEIDLEMGLSDKALGRIKKFESIQSDIVNGTYGETYFPVNRNERLLCAYSMNCYLQKKDLTKVKHFLDKANSIKETDQYVDFFLMVQTAKYFTAIGHYDDALKYADKIIKVDSSCENLMLRASIYEKMGNFKAASSDYSKALRLQLSDDNKKFYKDVASFQSLYDKMQIQMQLKNSELSLRKMQNIFLFWAVVALTLFLVVCLLFILHDVKMKKRLRHEDTLLRESRANLSRALVKSGESNRMKNNFLINISHEIRTPLNSIVGFSSVLTSELSQDDESVEYCNMIQKGSDELVSIVDNIVEMAKVEAANSNLLNLELHNVAKICSEAVDELELSGKLKKSVKILINSNPNDYMLVTDSDRLRQVIFNLIDNSAKNTTSGSITIEYRVEEEHKRVVFSVTDTGTGIDEDIRDSIFDPFEKGDQFAQGIGLGLSICKLLVDDFKGTIYLDKEYKNGVKIVFTHSTELVQMTK